LDYGKLLALSMVTLKVTRSSDCDLSTMYNILLATYKN